jgi:murein peptide amidase A
MRISNNKNLHTRSAILGILLIALQAIIAPAIAQNTVKNTVQNTVQNTPKNEVFCQAMAKHLPNVTVQLCMQANLVDTGALSVKGAPLLKRDMPPVRTAADTPTLRVMVVGGIHGDELSSSSLALRWISLAAQTPANAPNPVHWRFIPMLNPDGLMAQPAKRVNANGVDLNRNFPTPNWSRDAKIYWEQRTNKDPRRWPGKEPLSEPESKFLHDDMASFKPHLIVSIHAPYGVLDFDGPTVPPSKLGRLYLDQVGIFPGSLGNYGGVHKGMPVVTIELPNAQRTPLDAETRQMWLDLLRWMGEKVKPGPEKP